MLLKVVNHTFLALIPKASTSIRVKDYRPISCCNVIYKCISKILTNLSIEGIKEVVSENQSAFVPGRRISDNILITQELMHNYHRNRGPPRCAFKVDIQKAYDTVDWCFLENILVSINGTIHGFFKGKRDDLFICAHGDVESARVIMDLLDKFKKTSGLVLSIPKSTTYFCNVLYHTKLSILGILPFCEGIIHDIQQLIHGFLWCNGEYKRGKAKVAWDVICLLKYEGGLESLWVRWIHTYKLRSRTFWDIPKKADMSWGWLKLLQLCDLVRPFFWVKLGNGASSSLCLKMQDMMRQWDVGIDTDLNLLRCALCDAQPDLHTHLFFECAFSSQVWYYARDLDGMDLVPPVMHDILLYLQPMANKRTARSVFGRLILAATTYHIWLERNNRVFKKVRLSSEEIRDIIMVTVRLKLLTFRFKNTAMVRLLLSRWKMPKSFRLYG
nr:hypothetical protein [Tanacetum cinerariifolium]